VLAGLFDPRRRARGASSPPPPLRLLIFGHLEGNIPTAWRPTGTETSFVLSDVTAPLAPWQSKLLVLDGFNNQTAIKDGASDPHFNALTGMLTGRTNPKGLGDFYALQHGLSESLDQYLRDKVNGATLIPSLELSVASACVTSHNGVSYPRGGGPAIGPVGSPSAAFDRMFAGFAAAGTSDAEGDDAAKRLRTMRGSVLDHVTRELASLTGQLGADDARKIQAHLDAIRDIEKQLTPPSPRPASCRPPLRPTDLPTNDKSTIPPSAKLMMDLIAQAFACDLTRVITFAIPTSGFAAGAPWLGEPRDIHFISHGEYVDAGANWLDIGPRIMRWSYEQQAYLMKRLDEIPEGDGTVLDHTLILSISEFGHSPAHDYRSLPIILCGDAGGYLKSGRFLQVDGQPHNDVLVTVANAMGVDTATFGDPTLCQGGPLASLRA
jgi:hypothetical protein